MPKVRHGSKQARTMGSFSGDPLKRHAVPPQALEPMKLTRLIRDERCDECDWPEVCAADRTCWHEERDA